MEKPILSARYWNVFLNENQSLPGKALIWCKRKNALHLSDATPAEWNELKRILKALKAALERAFSPDWFNFEALGNKVAHLHVHVVPRYKSDVSIQGVRFEDIHYGKPNHPNQKRSIPLKARQAIRKRLKEELIRAWKS